MSDDELLMIAVVLIGAYFLFNKKPSGSTGIVGINPGNGPLLPCCDANGDIVDAGGSIYCPQGTTVC